MYQINSVGIEIDKIVSNVTLFFKDGQELVVTVPVKLPQSKADVIAAIEYRERLENEKHDAAPILEPIKAELEAKSVGRLSTETVK